VFNPKVSGIIAGIAFVLSILIGLFTGSQFFPVMLRAFILAIVFFVLSSLVYWLLSQFLPELLTSSSNESNGIDIPGSKVDISIDADELSDDIDSVPIRNAASESVNSIQENNGDIDDQSSLQGLDQKPPDDYNKAGDGNVPQSLVESEKAAVPGNGASDSGEYSKSLDVLPDLESMSDSFTPVEEEEESDVVEMDDDLSSASSIPSMGSELKRSSRKNADPGDFNTQELASAIQTILRRDEKG
jgi:hypothetical protein